MDKSELLQFALDNDMIDLSLLQKQIEMNERKKYLEMHTQQTWQGSDGKWYTYLPDETKAGKRRLLKRVSEDKLEDAIVSFYKSTVEEPTVQTVFQDWINEKLQFGEIQKQTYDRYTTDFTRFFHVNDMSTRKIRYVTEDDLRLFIKTNISEKQLTSKAWSGLRTLLVGIFSYAKERKLIALSITSFLGDLNLSKRIFAQKEVRPENLVFTNEEVQQIIQYVLNEDCTKLSLAIVLMFQTGLRPGELVALQWKDILDDKVLVISKTEIRYKDRESGEYVYTVRDNPKTDAGNRNVILVDSAIETLVKLKELTANYKNGDYIFMREGKRIIVRSVTRKLYNLCKVLGITVRSSNKARKTYSTKLINSNVSESVIIGQVGHVDISTTKKYYYYNNVSFDETKEQLNKALFY